MCRKSLDVVGKNERVGQSELAVPWASEGGEQSDASLGLHFRTVLELHVPSATGLRTARHMLWELQAFCVARSVFPSLRMGGVEEKKRVCGTQLLQLTERPSIKSAVSEGVQSTWGRPRTNALGMPSRRVPTMYSLPSHHYQLFLHPPTAAVLSCSTRYPSSTNLSAASSNNTVTVRGPGTQPPMQGRERMAVVDPR